MKNEYSITFCLAVVALLALSFQSKAQNSQLVPTVSTSAAPAAVIWRLPNVISTQSRQEVLRAEAQQFAHNYWRRVLTKCGDSYYWKHQTVYGQKYYEAQREPSIMLMTGSYVPPKQLTRAEQLNDEDPQPVEFEGYIRLKFEAFRADETPSALSNRRWHEGFQQDTKIYKRKGKWITGAGEGDPLKPVKCSEITAEQRMRRGVELRSYCTRMFGSSAVETVRPGDAFSWQCKSTDGYFKVDMDQACKLQYGGNFKAAYDDADDHKSWHCVLKNLARNDNKPTAPASRPVIHFLSKMVKDFEIRGGGRAREWEVTVPKTGEWISTGIPVSVNQDIFILSPLLSGTPTFSMKLGNQIIQSEFNETTRQGWILRSSLREQGSGGGKGRWAVPNNWSDVITLKVADHVQASALNLRVAVSDVPASRREGDKNEALAMLDGSDAQQLRRATGGDSDAPRLKPKSGSPGDVYAVRLFNCDDRCKAIVNVSLTVETGFGQDSGWIDVTARMKQGGQVKFQVINDSGAIAYGFQVKKNGTIVFEKICGTSRIVGCENNRDDFPVGVAREFTYDLTGP